MKTLVLYKTKYGSTGQYAKWTAEELRADLADIGNFDINRLKEYDTIIIGSPTYMGQIQLKPFLEKNWETLKDRHVYLFTVGMFPSEASASKKSYEMIPEHIRNQIGYAKIFGRIDMEKLKLGEKLIAKMAKARTADKVKKSSIDPIIEWVNNLD